jgi:hypothetical protein
MWMRAIALALYVLDEEENFVCSKRKDNKLEAK